jgi:PAS domain S-box-containing protein
MAVALLIRIPLDPTLLSRRPYLTLFGAVAFSIWYGRWRPAAVAAVLGFLAANYLVVEPREVFRFDSLFALDAVGYALSAGLIIALGEAMHRARDRAEHSAEERAIAEEAERRQKELLRVTFASIGDAIITTDAGARITFLNQVAESITGWTANDAAGQPLEAVFNIVNADTRRPVESPAVRALREGLIVGLANHTVLLRRDGTERPIDDSAAPIRDSHGNVLGCVLVFRDITARRNAEDQRRWTEERIRSILNNVIDGIITIDERGLVQTMNPAAERIFGYAESEVLGRNVKVLMPSPYSDEHDGYLSSYLRTGQPKVIGIGREVAGRRKDGTTFPMDLAVGEYSLGGTHHFAGIVRDITDRKRAEASLREQAQLLDLAHDAVIVRGTDGVIAYWNSGAQELYGWAPGDAIGRMSHDLLQTRFPRPLAEIEAELAEQGRWEGTLRHVSKDGTRLTIASRWALRKGGEADHDVILEVNRDVTEQTVASQALREADRRKDEFLATLAHELRNPLAPIRNAIQILLVKGRPDPELLWCNELIDRQVQHMSRLLDDLFDVSRITRGKLELRPERFELAEIVRTAIEISRPHFERRGQQLDVSLPKEPIAVHADSVRLAQVFANLLNNAAKYTPSGGHISVTCERQDGAAVVSVTDDGVGIDPELLPGIFEIFSQAPKVLSGPQEGLGIGLSLVRSLVQSHGGTVEAHSEGPGKGSRFVVRLPVLVQAAPQPPVRAIQPAAKQPVLPSRLLIADDLRDSADSLALLLRLHGHEVRAVYDGDAALKAAEEFRPDIALLDIAMPKRDGYETCRSIRGQPWSKGMYIVAVTGWGQQEDRLRAQQAGFDHHLVKPVDPAALVELLAQRPARRAGTAPA